MAFYEIVQIGLQPTNNFSIRDLDVVKDSFICKIKQSYEFVSFFLMIFDTGQNDKSPSGIVDTEV